MIDSSIALIPSASSSSSPSSSSPAISWCCALACAMNADNRKGELADLKSQLRQLAGSRQPGVEDLKRELYKKVISYMTIGIDVSTLFSEMVMCSATSGNEILVSLYPCLNCARVDQLVNLLHVWQ